MDYEPTNHDSRAPPLVKPVPTVTIPKNYIEVYEFGFAADVYIYIYDFNDQSNNNNNNNN